MEEELEIILRAIDEASNVFSSITGSAEDMSDTISDSVDNASGSFEDLSGSAEDVAGSIDDVSASSEDASSSLEDAASSADDVASSASSIDSSSLDELANSASNASNELQETANNIDAIVSAGFQMEVFNEVSDTLMDCADAAGNYEDRMTRVSLAMEGVGMSAEQTSSLVSDLGDVTGRSAASINESLIMMTSAGITSADSMKALFEGAAGQAFILGKSVEQLTQKYSMLSMSTTISTKLLKGTGITMEELADAMDMHGASLEEIQAKWKSMSTDARAAILGEAAAMNEGQNANDAYKNSWEGLHDHLDMATGKLQRLAGEVLLPTLIPAIQIATGVLNALGSVVSWVMSSPLGGLVSILGAAAAGFVVVVTAVSLLSTVMEALGIVTTLNTIETIALAIAENGLSISSIAAALGAQGLTLGLSEVAVAAWGAASGIWAMLAPLLPFIAIGAAIIGIIYAIGNAFGWWHDVGSMIDAIWAGLQRLWSAFINHPDVQAVIKAIGDAWNWVVSGITWAWNALLNFFGVATGGGFDIVRALIDGIGAAWNAITFPIRLVISAVQWLVGAFQNASNAVGGFGNVILIALGPIGWIIMGIQRLIGALNGGGGIGDALKSVQQAFTTVWTAISGFISGIVTPIINMFQQLYMIIMQLWEGNISLGEAIGMIWGTISSTITQVVTHIVESIINFATTLGEWALKAGQAFLTGLISFFTQLPGMIWNILTGVVTSIASLFGKGVSDQVGSSLGKLGEVFHSVWTGILNVVSSVVGPIVDMISTLIGVFQQLWTGQISLGEAIGMIWETISSTLLEVTTTAAEYILEFATNVYNLSLQAGEWFLTNIWNFFSQIPTVIWNFLLNAYTFIVTTMSQWITGAVSKVSMLVSQVVSWFSQLPTRIWSWLVNVGTRILSAGSSWISYAQSRAVAVVSAVISTVSGLPGKVYNEFMKIATRIRDAISAAVRAATQFGSDIVQAVLSALHIASPGIIQRKTVKEFKDTIKRILGLTGDAYNAGEAYGASIVDGFGNVDLESGLATDLNTGQLFDITTGQSYDVDTTQHIDGEIVITHDLENVPDNLNENQIAELINNSTRSDEFMKRIAESVSFQKYDSREKLRIQRRDGRSRGV